MDKQRTILWALFASLFFLTWSQWQVMYPPQTVTAPEPAATASDSLPPVDAAPADAGGGDLVRASGDDEVSDETAEVRSHS